MIAVIPLTEFPEVEAGDDIALLLRNALGAQDIDVRADDILVVTQKIVSKAEGRSILLRSVDPGAEAQRLAALTKKDPRLVELILRQTEAVVRAAPGVLIVRTRLGPVMANAGIDQSNVGPGERERVLLLPLDPDASAARFATALGCGVIISDSFGRPWRLGVTAVAIGAAGVPALVDRRGDPDRDGRPLEVTQVAIGDLLASAAGLAMGEGQEGVPATLIRGMAIDSPATPASALIRPPKEDLFP